MAQLSDIQLVPTRVYMPGATEFQLVGGIRLVRPDVIVVGREFAHLHQKGSLHRSLNPHTARLATSTSWAIAHLWSHTRSKWEGFVMIYTSDIETELATAVVLVKASFSFAAGRMAEDQGYAESLLRALSRTGPLSGQTRRLRKKITFRSATLTV